MKFYANINLEDPNSRITYDFRAFGESMDLVENDEHKYCLLQCTKIGYYISKVHNIEILRMNCEFLKDENSTIWFSHATKIAYRFVIERGS